MLTEQNEGRKAVPRQREALAGPASPSAALRR